MGVVRREPIPARRLVAALLMVIAAGLPAACSAQCARSMETSSPMFGATWADSFVLYTQDYNWKTSGDITKVNLFYGEAEGCVKGVKAQYGSDPANSQRLGIETKTLQARSLQLKAGERIMRAEYKASAKCIEYLSLRTNQGRQLAVGKFDSPTATAFAAPTSPGGYLGYINGHTAKPMTNPNVGKLMQLQFVWATTECDASASVSAATAGAGSSSGSSGKKRKKQGPMRASLMGINGEGAAGDGSSSSSEDSATGSAQCRGNHLCVDGKCATSSCMLAGMGADIPNMQCFGTNMRLPFLSSGVDVSPCSFLGCKLDMASCTSSGVLGVGGFCTGRVVAMGAASILHPQGKQWVGYPCVEHRANTLGLRGSMLGDLTSAEDTVAKAWKVCDCVKTTPLRNRLAIMMPNGTISSYVFGQKSGQAGQQGQGQQQQQQPTVAVPLMPVFDMGLKDVVTQWLAARAGEAVLPTATISNELATDLRQLVPGFMTPSIMVANTSAALMTRPEWMVEVPVFVLTNQALTALKAFMPDLTSLPTLALAPNMTVAEASTMLELPAGLQVQNITVDALPALAAKLGLPTFLKLHPSTSTSKPGSNSDVGPHIVPLNEMHIGNVVVQWATAVYRKAALPTLTVASKEQLAKLQAKIPGLVTPSIVVASISSPLLYKPEKPALPVFVLPAEETDVAMATLPDITALPSFLVLPEQAKQELPKLHLTDFIAPNMRVLVDTLGPSIPVLLKQVSDMTLPALNSTISSMVDNPALMPWGGLLSAMPVDLLLAGAGGVGGNGTGFDMGSINEVVAAVKEALTTSGFKLPYLTMTDDTLEKWGLRQIESFVTNVVTQAGTPREDHGLIDDSEDEEDYATDDEDSDGSDEEVDQAEDDAARRRARKRSGSSSGGSRRSGAGAEETAHKHNKVAAALNALREEELRDHAGGKKHQAVSGHKSAQASIKKKQKSRKQLGEEQDQAADDEEAAGPEDQAEDEEEVKQQQKPKQKQKPADAAAAGGKAAGKEPAAKQAFSPAPAAAVPPSQAGKPAAAAPVGSPVPIQGAKSTTLPPPPAAAPKAAAAQQQQPAAAAAPSVPVGTEDEDGAVVIDEAAAKMAFLSEQQWNSLSQEHKDKLLMLIGV